MNKLQTISNDAIGCRTEIARSGTKMTETRSDAYGSEAVHFSRANGVAAHYEYAPFGEITAQVRQGGITAYDFATLNPWRFSSEYADDASATVYYNYRHYEPIMGRWMSVDPAPSEISGLNKYAYCYNYPLSLADYIGLAGDTTHGTKKCRETDSCSDLAVKLSDWIKHYAERHKELLEDKLGLKTNDPHT